MGATHLPTSVELFPSLLPQLLSNCSPLPCPRNLQQGLCAGCPLNQWHLKTHFAQAGPRNVQFLFLPEFAKSSVFCTDGLPLKECFVWDKVLAETCLVTCQLTFWYVLIRLLGCHGIRSRRAKMVSSSSSSPWRFLAAWLSSSSQRA